jgi:hypothetical protein
MLRPSEELVTGAVALLSQPYSGFAYSSAVTPVGVNRNHRLVANHPSVVPRRDLVRLAGSKNNAFYLVLSLS